MAFTGLIHMPSLGFLLGTGLFKKDSSNTLTPPLLWELQKSKTALNEHTQTHTHARL